MFADVSINGRLTVTRSGPVLMRDPVQVYIVISDVNVVVRCMSVCYTPVLCQNS